MLSQIYYSGLIATFKNEEAGSLVSRFKRVKMMCLSQKMHVVRFWRPKSLAFKARHLIAKSAKLFKSLKKSEELLCHVTRGKGIL